MESILPEERDTGAMSKTTFLFGAGASSAEGLPTGNSILTQCFRLFPNDGRIAHVKKFVRTFFNYSYPPTFEQVLTPVDVCLSKSEALSSEWDYDKLVELRDDLLYSLALTLDKTSRGSGKTHNEFISKLFRKSRKDVSFISFNYDIILDNALEKLRESNGLYVDYGVDFRNLEDWTPPIPGESISLLKLHGSLNWLLCPTCNSIKITPRKKGVLGIWTNFELCERDHTRQRPLLIAPTWVKLYDNPWLVQVWTKAESILRQSEKVVFIGYSLPDSDVHIRYLLLKSLYRRKTSPSVSVVTTTNGKAQASKRFGGLFKGTKCLPIGFERFSNNLEEYVQV
jgi:hypothetical protein